MEKVFFYESEGGELHKCMFAGLDHEGKPQWLMADQGCEVLTLSEYRDFYMNGEDVLLLCMEGEKVESAMMALLLGAVLQSWRGDLPKLYKKCIAQLDRWGIRWRYDALKMEVRILGYRETGTELKKYRFYITCEERGFVSEKDGFKSMGDLMDCVRGFFSALEGDAGIPVVSKRLVGNDEDDLALVDAEDRKMFDEVRSLG
jgi:hypothetical protein